MEMTVCLARLSIAEAVASRWRALTEGGSHCAEMSGRLAGAFDAAGMPWRILDLSAHVRAQNPLDFHYAVESGAQVYDLTYRQFDSSAPVPFVRSSEAVFAEWKDVRTANTLGWMQKRMSEGVELYRSISDAPRRSRVRPGGRQLAVSWRSTHILA